MGEVSTKEELIASILNNVYRLLKKGSFSESEAALDKALGIDFENEKVVNALKCVNFWKEKKIQFEEIEESFKKGEYLLKEWKIFINFFNKYKKSIDQELYTIRQWVFSQALYNYLELYSEKDENDVRILFSIGRCYKGLGDYVHALNFIEMANHQKREDSEILAELADCYALINEVKVSKVFFREAFFINPGKIQTVFLESLLIQRLIEKVRLIGYSSPELEEWIPIYGVVYGVFNIKRELKPLEYEKLRQSIYFLENSLIENKLEDERKMIPRLITKYFWLIDHYICSRNSRDKIEEILKKIKELDNSVYEMYVN